MKILLKTARLNKGLKIREVAQLLGVDQALISKFESGTRNPTKSQIQKLSNILDIPLEKLMVLWIKEKIVYEIRDDNYALEALKIVQEEIAEYQKSRNVEFSSDLQSVLDQIDELKKRLDDLRDMDSFRIAQALELEYTFESNRIEGNTLTLRETDLVINEGLTISGKSMREHLEAINHKEAIDYIKHLLEKDTVLSEKEVLNIHNLVLRGIIPEEAGRYRKVQVMIQGSKHLPPQPYLIGKQMEDYFIWYETHKNILHPIVLAAEMHERLVTIHPFIDGNGRTSRLVMNLILLKSSYVIANIKGDYEERMKYYNTLEQAQTASDKEAFFMFIAQVEKEGLERYLSIIG